MIDRYGLDLAGLALDMTSFATYIDSANERAPIAQRGKARQKRTDLRLVGLALVVTGDGGIPIVSHAYAGQHSPAGVHRSDPIRWTCAYGSLVVVRNQDMSGRDWLELHAQARLGDTTLPTQEQASRLAVEVDSASRRIALPAKPARPPIVAKGHPR